MEVQDEAAEPKPPAEPQPPAKPQPPAEPQPTAKPQLPAEPLPLLESNQNILKLQEAFPNVTEDELRLVGAILDHNDDLTRALYGQKYGKLLNGAYDWAVIVLMISLGFATDVIASANNPDASGEWDTVFLGMSSSIIVLVSHMESWFKTHFIGADSAIGIVFALDRLLKSIKLALDGAKYITLPGWMLNAFMMFMILMSKKYISTATAYILYINLALNCIVLQTYYPLFFMMGVLLYVRGDFTAVDGLLRNHTHFIAIGFVILLSVIFGYIEFKAYKDEPFLKQFLNMWLNSTANVAKTIEEDDQTQDFIIVE